MTARDRFRWACVSGGCFADATCRLPRVPPDVTGAVAPRLNFHSGKNAMTGRTRFLLLSGVIAGATAGPAFAQSHGPAIPDTEITRAGQTFHDVSQINREYNARLASTSDASARQQIVNEDRQKGAEACARHGLTVSEYQRVLGVAQQDPTVRQKLLAAAGNNR